MKVINAKWVLLVVVLILLIFGFIFQTNFQWTSSHPSSLSFSIDEQLRSTLQEVDKFANLVHQRFQFDNEENIPENGWDIIKYKIAKKILTQGSFVMVFSGSSVTSGHGNHFNHSYTEVLYRRLNPLFSALGVKLEVRNVAHKFMGCRLMNYCLQTMGGSGFDFVGWEHSFDCGTQRDVFEFFARVAGWNKAVAYYSASGSFNTADCRPTRDPIAWTDERWLPDLNAHIPYRVTPERVKEMRKSEGEWFRDGSAVARFTQMLRRPHKSKASHLTYDGVAAHGFNVWAKSKRRCRSSNSTTSSAAPSAMYAALQRQQQHSKKQKPGQVEEGCAAVDVKGSCYDKGGPHWMVQESSVYGADESGSGQQHHPSMALHLMRAEVLGYHYAHIIADAIFMIQADLADTGRNISALTSKYELQLSELQQPIPEDPWFCSPWECKLSPTCFTDYEPQYATRNSLSEIVLGSHQGWRREKVEEYHSIAAMGYRERRIYYKALGGNRHIHLMIRNVRANTIKVYGRFAAESIRHCIFFLDPNVNLQEVAAEARRSNEYEYIPTKHRFRISSLNYTAEDESMLLRNLPNGNHVLTLLTDRSRPDSVTSLSHVVVF